VELLNEVAELRVVEAVGRSAADVAGQVPRNRRVGPFEAFLAGIHERGQTVDGARDDEVLEVHEEGGRLGREAALKGASLDAGLVAPRRLGPEEAFALGFADAEVEGGRLERAAVAGEQTQVVRPALAGREHHPGASAQARISLWAL